MATQTNPQRILTNRKGRELTTGFTDKEACKLLAESVRDGNAEDFAVDLHSKGQRYGFSDEQMWWVHYFALKASEPRIVYTNINAAFQRALINHVSPRKMVVLIQTDDLLGTVKLSFAGQRSRYYGSVWITDEGTYPDNQLYGRIDGQHGVLNQGRAWNDNVKDLLNKVEENVSAYLPW